MRHQVDPVVVDPGPDGSECPRAAGRGAPPDATGGASKGVMSGSDGAVARTAELATVRRMHTYRDHHTTQHRIERIRPDLAAPATGPTPAATGAGVDELLPLPTRPDPVDVRFGITTVDDRGRLSLAEACRTLGWTVADTGLQLEHGDGFVTVRETADESTVTVQLLTKHRLQLPTWVKDVAGLAPGTQVLTTVEAAGEVRMYPAAAVAAALTRAIRRPTRSHRS